MQGAVVKLAGEGLVKAVLERRESEGRGGSKGKCKEGNRVGGGRRARDMYRRRLKQKAT